jgi:HPt (histidine-containing phosphotransfer) domain-containing protein
MAMAAATIAFEAPDNHQHGHPHGHQHGSANQARPVDFDHLATQTMGDKALEAEVLQMFAKQARMLVQELAAGDAAAGTTATAHRLQGAAKAVGAFKVAATAERLENNPADAAELAAVHAAVVEVETFITGLCR